MRNYLQRNSNDLTERSSILNKYLKPNETKIFMGNVKELYSKNPEELTETIHLLKNVYSFSEKISPLVKKFIADLLRKDLQTLLSSNLKHLRKLITILEVYVDGEKMAELLRKNRSVFLSTDPIHFQNVRAILEEYLEKSKVKEIIVNHFPYIIFIEQSDAFVEIVKIMASHISEKEILYKSIDSLLKKMHFFSKEYDSLYEDLWKLNSKLDSNEMKNVIKNGEMHFFLKEYESLHRNLREFNSKLDSNDLEKVFKNLKKSILDLNGEKIDEFLRKYRFALVSESSVLFQNIRNIIEKYLGKSKTKEIIINHFHHIIDIILTEQSDAFVKVIKVMASHISEKEILYKRIDGLLREMHLFSKEYDSLYENLWELNLKLNHKMKRVLGNLDISLLELSYYQYEAMRDM